jgi:hypothetical protein
MNPKVYDLITVLICLFSLYQDTTYAQNPIACGNGQPWQLAIGMIGQVNPIPPTPSHLRKIPDGKAEHTIEAGEFFRVIDGPQCTSSSGMSWWYIRDTHGREGWISQGTGEEYWIIPFETPEDFYVENFKTSLQLDMNSPVINIREQLSLFGGAGGRDCIMRPPLILHYLDNRVLENVTFQVQEKVIITIYRPDGTLYWETTTIAGELGGFNNCKLGTGELSFEVVFNPHEPSGIWSMTLEGTLGKYVSYDFLLQPSTYKNFSLWCEDRSAYLLFEGFESNQKITLQLVKVGNRVSDDNDALDYYIDVQMEWQITLDEQGQMIVFLPSEIEFSYNLLLYVPGQNLPYFYQPYVC